MADAHKYRTLYHDDGSSSNSWTGSVAVRSIGGGCSCGWQGQPRPDTADGGVQAFNDWWTDHYTPLVRPDPGELLILSHTGGMRCHYLAGRPVASGTRLELRLSGRRWVPVRYEWSARADAAPRFYMELGGPWESFDEHGPETYVMLQLERTVFRWPVGNELDLLPPTLEPMFGPGYGADDAFRRSLTPPPPSALSNSMDFSPGRNGYAPLARPELGSSGGAAAHGNSYGQDLFADSMDFSSGRNGRDTLGDSLELPGSGRTYRLHPGQGGFPGPGGQGPRPDRGMTDPYGFRSPGPYSGQPGRAEPPGYYDVQPPHGGPAIEPRRPAGPPPAMFPTARDSFAGRPGGTPMGNNSFVDGQSWDGRQVGDHGGRPMDGRPMDGRPMDGRPMDGRPMDGPPMRPPPGMVPELPPPGGGGPRRTRIGRPPSNFPGGPPAHERSSSLPVPGGMNGNGTGPTNGSGGMNGNGGMNGADGSIQDQVSRLMREATDEARRVTRPYQEGTPESNGHGHPRYQGYQDYQGHEQPYADEQGRPPEDPWRRPYDG